jgi:hypothetical protein
MKQKSGPGKAPANVVRYEVLSALEQINFIETSWRAERPSFVAGHGVLQRCSTYCAKGACVPVSACVKDDEGHVQQSRTMRVNTVSCMVRNDLASFCREIHFAL